VAVEHVRDLTDPVGAAREGAEFRGQLGLAAVDASRGQGDPGGGGAAPITGFLYLVVDVEDDLTRRAHVGCEDGGCLGGGRGRHRTDQRNGEHDRERDGTGRQFSMTHSYFPCVGNQWQRRRVRTRWCQGERVRTSDSTGAPGTSINCAISRGGGRTFTD